MASTRNVNTDYDYDSRDRVQRVEYEELDNIRPKELALVRRERQESYETNDNNNNNDYYEVRNTRRVYDDEPAPRQRSLDGALAPYNGNRQVYDNRSSRRRDVSPPSSDSESEDSRERERRRRRRHRRREKESSSKSADNNDRQDGAGEGLTWFGHKPRKDGTFMERHLDSSYDGIVAAIAGGLIGGMTAKRFAGEENSTAKVLGGALVGAASFNAVENKYRIYTEERTERKEEKWEDKWGKD